MKAVFLIGHNDLRMFLREKTIYIWLFVVPMIFVYFMGFAFRGPGGPSIPQPSVLIENKDTGFLGSVFIEELGAQGLRWITETNQEKASRSLQIPADFTERVLKKEQVKVGFFTVSGSGDEAAAMVELRVWRAVLSLNAHLVESVAVSQGQLPDEAGLRAMARREGAVRLKTGFAGRKPVPSGFNLSLPGNLVSYLLMNLTIFGGATLAWERRSGVLRRLVVFPIRRRELLLGKLYGLMLLGLVQIVFFLVVGRFLFGINLGANLWAVAITLGVFAWVAASLGLLAGSLITAEEKVIGVSVLVSLSMAALGGCWWPLEIAPDLFKTLAHLVPTGWAMDALHQVISFGGGFAEAKEEIGVLVLFGAVANWAASRYFRIA
jgi:ABC-type multidrug transport system permease subunit